MDAFDRIFRTVDELRRRIESDVRDLVDEVSKHPDAEREETTTTKTSTTENGFVTRTTVTTTTVRLRTVKRVPP